jgi:hypothetical protein
MRGMSSYEEKIVADVRKSFEELAIGDIERAIEGKAFVGAFILCCCLLDSLSGFCFGQEPDGSTFTNFCARYLEKVDVRYRAIKLYKALRCGLLHGYSPVYKEQDKSWQFYLRDDNPEEHLKIDQTTTTTIVVLNLPNFLGDIKEVLKQFFEDVADKSDKKKTKDNLIKFAKQSGWLEVVEESNASNVDNNPNANWSTLTFGSTGPRLPTDDQQSFNTGTPTRIDETE